MSCGHRAIFAISPHTTPDESPNSLEYPMAEYAMRHKQTLEGTLLLKLDDGDALVVGRVSIPVEFDVTARIPDQKAATDND